jgi:hypothetical protein
MHWTAGATALAGGVGAVIAFGLSLMLGRSLVREPVRDTPPAKL